MINLSELYSIGSTICCLRVQKHISQPSLAKGLCSPSTLSRIELGERESDKLLSDALLQRLGKSPNRFDFLLDELDFDLFEQRETIKSLIQKGEYNIAESKLQSYQYNIKFMTPLQKQFIKKYSSVLQWKSAHNPIDSISKLKESLFITLPCYESSLFPTLQLTFEEKSILLEISNILKEEKEYQRAITIITQLFTFLDTAENDDYDFLKLYSSLTFSAAHIYYMQNDYKNALKICEKGILHSSKHNCLQFFAELLCIRAYSKEHLFKRNKPNFITKACIQDYLTAITLFSLRSQKEQSRKTEAYLKENYSWESIQSEMLFKNREEYIL